MTVAANSYGDASDVASRRWVWVAEATVAGVFDTTTLPKLTQVESWINEVSAVMNTALRKWGFTTPLTDVDDVLAVKSVVAGLVAELTDDANSTGRFFTERSLDNGRTSIAIIMKEINDWVEAMADGLNSTRDLDTTSNKSFSYAPIRDDGYHAEAVANEY